MTKRYSFYHFYWVNNWYFPQAKRRLAEWKCRVEINKEPNKTTKITHYKLLKEKTMKKSEEQQEKSQSQKSQ